MKYPWKVQYGGKETKYVKYNLQYFILTSLGFSTKIQIEHFIFITKNETRIKLITNYRTPFNKK